MTKITHNDVMESSEEWLTEKFTETPEGYLTGRAIVTNVGVFTYRDVSGNVIRELRPPEEVRAYDSLQSLKMKPLTNNHPDKRVTAENVKKYSIGMVGDAVSTDSYCVSVPVTVTDAESIADAKDGKRALSCGYDADLEWTPGVWMGVEYDCIQRNIRYNHVALVNKGRAGDLARMIMDSVDVPRHVNQNKTTEDNGMANMKKLTIDGVEYEAEADVIKAYSTLKADNAEKDNQIKLIVDEKTKLTAERDAVQGKLDAAVAELEEMKKLQLDESKISAIVTKRLEVMDSATAMGADVVATMSEIDMMKAGIAKVLPKVDLADKDVVYISAMFDACKETHSAQTVQTETSTQKTDTADKSAYEKYVEDLKNAYKKGDK